MKITRRRERRYRRHYNRLVRRHALLSRRENREDYGLMEPMTAADFRATSGRMREHRPRGRMVAMVEIERYRFYRATVRIRRGDGWDVKPEAEALDGQRVHVEAMYGLDAEDCGGKYDGELAMWFVGADRGRWPIAWIASGDLVDVEEAERPAELGSPPLPYPVNWTA